MVKTFLNYNNGGFHRNGHRVMCADGKIRAAELAPHPDTHFSVSAWVRIRGKRISGYVTSDEWTEKIVFRPHVDSWDIAPELKWPSPTIIKMSLAQSV